MKRLLCIVGSMSTGGAETFLMKIYRGLDKSKYQMDFCVFKEEKGFYDDEIKSMGGKIIHAVPKTKNFLKSFISIQKIVKENNYKYVMRISQHSLSALELFAAKLGGAKVRVFRSSNTNSGGNKINLFLHYLFRPLANIISNVKISPSTEAAIYMFGKRNSKKVIKLKNAISYEQYKYDVKKREELRNINNLSNKFVIGHVGRFVNQKNHDFIIEVFKKIRDVKKNAFLILVGTGELKEKIVNKINDYNLQNSVLILEPKVDINFYYSLFDVLIFPSYFEGLPNVVVEAQASDLPCFLSDRITKEVNITDNVYFLSIDDYDIWKERILAYSDYKRKDVLEKFKKNNYLIEQSIGVFVENIFNNRLGNNND